MAIGRGAGCVPPRRLRRRTISCSPSPSSSRRSGAGDDWPAHAGERKTNSSVRLFSAASCSRRSVLVCTSGSQATTAPTPSAASERSQAQAASRPGALATSRRDKSRPYSCSAGACSRCGGATQTSQASSSLDSRAKAGKSRLSSPMPRRKGRISVSPPRGQPPPGSSRSSSAKPVGTPGSGALASASPRQTSGRSRTCASVSDEAREGMEGISGPARTHALTSSRCRGSPRRQYLR